MQMVESRDRCTRHFAIDHYGVAMELRDALRTTNAVREFQEVDIPDDTLFDILDDARFAPSGGNRQAWHVIVLDDASLRARLQELYLDGWYDYVAHLLAGLVPFSPLASEEDRHVALTKRAEAESAVHFHDFAQSLVRVPRLLVVTADIGSLAAVDRDLGRYTIAGGASIYPFVWQILLAARERGIGGVMTTMATRNEPAVREVLNVPADHAIAAVVALGYPVRTLQKLTRRPVASFTTRDQFNGPAFEG